MVFLMARPTKLLNSRFPYARKVVPAALRAILGRTEFKRPLRAVDPADLRRLHRAAMTEFEAQIETARAKLKGNVRTLSEQEISAICGEWYRHELADRGSNPGDAAAWDIRRDDLLDQIDRDDDAEPFAPDARWLTQAEGLLLDQHIAACPATIRKTAIGLFFAKLQFAETMLRRAQGDYRPDEYSARFATKAPASPPVARPIAAPAGLTFTVLIDAWATETRPPLKSREKWTATFAGFAALIGHDDATRVAVDDVRRWKQHRLNLGRSPKTVADGIAVMRSTFNWGARNGLLVDKNPFTGMAPKFKKHGLPARDGYTDEQAATVLQAARSESGWLRWVPWLLCLSGARIEEVAELRRRDIRQEGEVWILDIRPSDLRSLKTDQAQRMIPLHPALITEGFLGYVATLPADGPLWPDMKPGRYGTRGSIATKGHSRWVRGTVGITDKRIAPAHSFRHRMEDQLRKARVPTEAHDAITGHDHPRNAGAGYGRGYRGMPDELLKELSQVPSPLPLPTSQGAPTPIAAPRRHRHGPRSDHGGAVAVSALGTAGP